MHDEEAKEGILGDSRGGSVSGYKGERSGNMPHGHNKIMRQAQSRKGVSP